MWIPSSWRFLLSSRTWLAPVTLATRADEAGEPPLKVLRDLGQPQYEREDDPKRSARRKVREQLEERVDKRDPVMNDPQEGVPIDRSERGQQPQLTASRRPLVR